jgi:hypothetical protein
VQEAGLLSPGDRICGRARAPRHSCTGTRATTKREPRGTRPELLRLQTLLPLPLATSAHSCGRPARANLRSSECSSQSTSSSPSMAICVMTVSIIPISHWRVPASWILRSRKHAYRDRSSYSRWPRHECWDYPIWRHISAPICTRCHRGVHFRVAESLKLLPGLHRFPIFQVAPAIINNSLVGSRFCRP